MQHRSCNTYVTHVRGARPRVLVEGDTLDLTTLELTPPGAGAFEIVVCSGPAGDRECCPLVVDGRCPVWERPDVVVSALSADNAWSAAVHAAWEREGVRVATIRDDEAPLVWPA